MKLTGWERLRSVKNYFDDAPGGVKVWACTNNLNIAADYSKLMLIHLSF